MVGPLLQRHHVPHRGDGNTLRRIAPLERTDDTPAALRLCSVNQKARELLDVLILECERAERITLQ